jgi:glycosyltransferase involved in cell wall biosynthesis
MIPNYGKDEDERYFYNGTEVIRYAEPSAVTRALITGNAVPEGLERFIEIIKNESPDIVHFHELAGSNGLSLLHVKAIKSLGIKTVMTLHIAKYSCRTGTLMYKNKIPCDGVIREIRCSKCWLNDMGEKGMRAAFIEAGFKVMNALGQDTRNWNSSLGTALAMPKIIKKVKTDLQELESNTDAFIILTEWYKKVLLRNNVSEEHIHVIPQALPYSPTGSLERSQESVALRLIFIGRINHFKGIDILIEALKGLPQADVALDIYGSPTEQDYYDRCRAATAELKNIRWQGSISPEDVVSTISQHDVFCLPSAVCEMSPLVIQESFAADVPVLASDVYGNAEQIKDGNGWLFKFKDPESLRNILMELIKDRSLIAQAAQQIKEVQDFKRVAAMQNKIYEKILQS